MVHKFNAEVLFRHHAEYYQCPNCFLLQIKNPFWLNEAYSKPISALDTGIISRNISYSKLLNIFIQKNMDIKGKFLDSGGGHGILTRMMRDLGYQYFRDDRYCENLFALNFDLSDLEKETKFELVSAFEVFEHLPNPAETIETMFHYTDTIFFSTKLIPHLNIKSVDDWSYFIPECGQHITFYHIETLKKIADKYQAHLYTNNISTHIFTRKNLPSNPFAQKKGKFFENSFLRILKTLIRKIERNDPVINIKSLVSQDYEQVKKKLFTDSNF